jgi:sugar lactone lactonase YvrE
MSVRDIVQAAAGVSTGNPNAWDISKAYYDAGSKAGDLSSAVYANAGIISTQELSPQGVFFKPDGTKIYIVGASGDDINEYNLTIKWNLSTLSYVQNFSVSSQDTLPQDLFFKEDGTKLYVVGRGNDKVYEYSLSSAWDISTASYVQDFLVSSQYADPAGLFFKPDGTKMYVSGYNPSGVSEYDLSGSWDISTASFVQSFSVATEEGFALGLSFGPDGTKMYVNGSNGDDINEYSLSTAWDISSASYVQNFSTPQDANPNGLFTDATLSMFYTVGEANDAVYLYILGSLSVSAQDSTPYGLFFKPDGTKMYIVGGTNDSIYEYSLSTEWDINTASYVQSFSVATQETAPQDLFFKEDGSKVYIIGSTGDDVNEYNLSVPWDISTASYVQNFSVATEDTFPKGLFFKPDGTKMYVLGAVDKDVIEYDLSSAWDISTASYVQNFSVVAQDTTPNSLFFKPDGSKMYVVGSVTNRGVLEYDLTTPWDISTASFSQSYLGFWPQTWEGLYFKPDGSQFWLLSSSSDRVFTLTISPE